MKKKSNIYKSFKFRNKFTTIRPETTWSNEYQFGIKKKSNVNILNSSLFVSIASQSIKAQNIIANS